MQLEFELTYYDVAIYHISHNVLVHQVVKYDICGQIYDVSKVSDLS